MRRDTKNLLVFAACLFAGYYLYGRWWRKKMNREKRSQVQYTSAPQQEESAEIS